MARSLLVVNYPTISTADFNRIQNFRKQHDQLNREAIAPHFTLVFPIFSLVEEALVHHVVEIAQSVRAFNFVLRCAVLGNDVFRDYTHVFLVPDEGYSNIVKLHDRLYTGVLASQLRLDIPFVPHIGIANSRDAQSCKHLVDEINRKSFEISGSVNQLDVIWSEDDRVETIEQIPLIAQ